MQITILATFAYAVLQVLYGWIARRKHEAKVFLWLGLVLAGAIILGTVIFMSSNLDKKAALDYYNFFGWHVVGVCTGIALLLTGAMWLAKKKVWPNAIFFFLNVGFGVIWALTRFWLTNKTGN